ncbi:uncharacterized protein N7496_012162 [Penicillium cataractarum]|uniref:Mid2 domain-containing protein n=1 Tax=Penicillium cataractarum TaxID=2100454 RepID=A0A9W9RJ18_9EURO|nr:uncharacterized protein N7496_012162 [Penicillium cataractarum]KAJ5359749.1 hypothetical protein N7496_012162 [Penicillium cataractarum]
MLHGNLRIPAPIITELYFKPSSIAPPKLPVTLATDSERWKMGFLFLFTILTFSPLIEAKCFNPDRTIASSAVPCNSNSATFCCASDAICLSTGYCLSAITQPFTLYRGSCTDSGWGSFCAYYCVNYDTGSNAPIVSVGLNNDSRAIYCCGYQGEHNNGTKCSNGDTPFILDDGEMIFGRAALVNVTTNRPDPSTTGTANTTCGNDERSSSQNKNITLGLGVGVPLGVVALCAVAWALIERRRTRRHQPTIPGFAQVTGQVYVPPRRKSGPTELDQPSSTTSDTLIQGSPLVEIMGSESHRH